MALDGLPGGKFDFKHGPANEEEVQAIEEIREALRPELEVLGAEGRDFSAVCGDAKMLRFCRKLKRMIIVQTGLICYRISHPLTWMQARWLR